MLHLKKLCILYLSIITASIHANHIDRNQSLKILSGLSEQKININSTNSSQSIPKKTVSVQELFQAIEQGSKISLTQDQIERPIEKSSNLSKITQSDIPEFANSQEDLLTRRPRINIKIQITTWIDLWNIIKDLQPFIILDGEKYEIEDQDTMQ